jgi:cytohesin
MLGSKVMETAVRSLLNRIQDVVEFSDIEITDVNQKGMFGNTPLKVVTVWGDTAAMSLLLDAGADPNIKCEEGFVPLHFAASMGHSEAVRLLLDRKANVDVLNDFGQTPLDLARQNGSADIIQLLKPQLH